MRSPISLAAYHCEQTRSHACLAACAAMASARRDRSPPADVAAREQTLLGRWQADATLVEAAAAELGQPAIWVDTDDARSVVRIRTDIESGEWWHIVIMDPSAMNTLYARLSPPPPRFGLLDIHGLRHAVLLVDLGPVDFVCLDPWLPRAHQPLLLPTATFVAAWTGRFVPVYIGE